MLLILSLVIPAILAESRTTFDTRIVNGVDADPHEFPWQVSLQYWSQSNLRFSHICGAVVLDQNRILTAAHCVDHDRTASNYQVVVGEHKLSEDSGLEQRRAVSTLRIHASYSNSGGYNNDVAVLLLSSPITLNEQVQPATLPASGQTFVGRNCYISGWGRMVANGPVAETLQKAATSVISYSDCRSRLGLTGLLYLSSTDHICIFTGSNSACNGDSGGPLVCDVSSTSTPNWQLAGVTSWGLVDCPVGSPSVYARITNYVTWISQQ